MFVKMSSMLIETLSSAHSEEDFISWKELKEKLINLTANNYSDFIKILKGSKFMAKLPEIQKEKTVTLKEYAKLISSKPQNEDFRSEMIHLRSDLAELRRETAWLFNCFLSVIGTALFVYFVVSFYFDRMVSRIVFSLLAGLILFFIEVLLYIIRN